MPQEICIRVVLAARKSAHGPVRRWLTSPDAFGYIPAMRPQALAAYAAIAALLIVAAAAATHARYDSFHPCDWLRIDASLQSGMSQTVVRARIKARFLLRGVITPGPGNCLSEWWRVRRNGLPEDDATR